MLSGYGGNPVVGSTPTPAALRSGREARRRIADPFTWVRIPSPHPTNSGVLSYRVRMTIIATYQATDLHFSDDKIVARFDLLVGQGAPTVLQVVDTQSGVTLGAKYSLSLEPAAPDAVPVKVPQVAAPTEAPVAVPGQVPSFLGGTPGMVPQAVPGAVPVAVPGMTPQLALTPNQVPYPEPTPNQYVPQMVPQIPAVPYQVPYAVPQATPAQVPQPYTVPAPMIYQTAPNLVPQRYAVPGQAGYDVPPPMLPQSVPYLVPDRKDLTDAVRQIMMDEAAAAMKADADRQKTAFDEAGSLENRPPH